MFIAWDAFETILYDFAASQLLAFGREHADESFYTFAFCCNAEYGQVLLSLNSETALQQSRSGHYAGYTDEQAAELRWSIGDWRYMEEELAPSDDAMERWKEWTEEFAPLMMDDDDLAPEFMRRACRVALRLEANGALSPIRKDPEFTIYVADHDETDFDSWKRLIEERIAVAPPWSSGPWPIVGRHPEMARAIFVSSAERHDRGERRPAAYLLREAIARLPELQGPPIHPIADTDVSISIPEPQAWARAYVTMAECVSWREDELFHRTLEKAAAWDPNCGKIYFLRAQNMTCGPVEADVLDSAVRKLDRAIECDPKESRYYALRAELRARPSHSFYSQSLSDYTSALSLDPYNEKCLKQRAELLVQFGRHQEAIDDYSRIFSLHNSVVNSYVRDTLIGRAECHQSLKQYQEAIADWTLLFDHVTDPWERVDYLKAREKCFRSLGDTANADADAATAAQIADEATRARKRRSSFSWQRRPSDGTV